MENLEQFGQQEALPPQSSKRKYMLIAAIIAVVVGAGILVLLTQKEAPSQVPEVTNPGTITKDETASWQIYRNEELGFEVKYPSNFLVQEQTGTMDEDFYLVRVDFLGTDGEFTRIQVQSKNVGKNLTTWLLLDFVDFWKQQIIGHAADRIDQETVVAVSDGEGVRLAYQQGFEGSRIAVMTEGREYFYAILGDSDLTNQILSTFQFIEPIDTSDWQTYHNEEFGFEVKYPSLYREVLKEDTLPERGFFHGDVVKVLEYKDANILIISVYNKSFQGYPAVLGGSTFYFDIQQKKWVFDNVAAISPKRVDVPIEAYSISEGDVLCSWDTIVVPHPSYAFVVEIIDIDCVTLKAAGGYIPAPFDLQPDQILSTFRFIE